MTTSLLPQNRLPLEVAIEAVIRNLWDSLPIHVIRDFHNPDKCPVHLLPHLAREMSVDVWRDEWSEEQKRIIIKNSPEIHRLKGTREAIELTLNTFSQDYRFIEWWEDGADSIQGYENEAGTAYLELDASVLLDSQIVIADLLTAIDRAKRLTLHITINVVENISKPNGNTPVVHTHRNSRSTETQDQIKQIGQINPVTHTHRIMMSEQEIGELKTSHPTLVLLHTHRQ